MLKRLIGDGREDGHDKVGLGSIRRPVIGLALGGGAARGFAHIGILRTLLAHGIIPNVVVGTSIGAVVGGAYVAGQLDALEDWARSLQPRNILGYLDIRLNGSGLIGGDRLASQLEAAIGPTLIEELPLKFATVATEVRTGHEIWLTHGRIVDAMRASYALPGIFSPVLVGDRWLVDGALVNPVPVSAARALGAEIVIAANLSSDIFSTTIYAHGPTTGNEESSTTTAAPPASTASSRQRLAFSPRMTRPARTTPTRASARYPATTANARLAPRIATVPARMSMPIRSEKPRRPNTIASRIMAISTTISNTMKPMIATTPQPAEGRGRSRSAVFIAA